MSDPMELVERLEKDVPINLDWPAAARLEIIKANVERSEAAACIRELVEWRPIETAPKDGTEIVGFDRRTGTGHVTLADQWGRWTDPDHHYYSEAEPFNPTHWLPLPSPPADRGGV